jgi:hypothetical protein
MAQAMSAAVKRGSGRIGFDFGGLESHAPRRGERNDLLGDPRFGMPHRRDRVELLFEPLSLP